MKLIILTVLCFGTVYIRGEGDCGDQSDDHPEGCLDDPNIARISCTGGTCSCTMTEGGACDSTILPQESIEALPNTPMSGEECRKLCETSKTYGSTFVCEYFRWEKDGTPDGSESEHCTLMETGQCKIYEPCGEPDICQSGQAGCTTDDNPGPEGDACKSEVQFGVETGAVHWKCINPFDEEGTHIDIYGSAPVPSGTICWTVRRCVEFDDQNDDMDDALFVYRNIVVQCDNPALTDADGGEWVIYPDSDNAITNAISAPGRGNNLKDPICNALPADLVLDAPTLHEPGVSFICSKQDEAHFTSSPTDVTIIGDNTCALLCNFHHVMTIEPKFDESDGTSKFWKYTTGGGDEQAIRDNVYCWSPPGTPDTFE